MGRKGEGTGKERGSEGKERERKGSCWLLGMGGMVKERGRKGRGGDRGNVPLGETCFCF